MHTYVHAYTHACAHAHSCTHAPGKFIVPIQLAASALSQQCQPHQARSHIERATHGADQHQCSAATDFETQLLDNY